jgi:hypothetical protein
MAFPSLKRTRYTYGDYLRWSDDKRWELIEGIAISMSPGPSRRKKMVHLAKDTSTREKVS